MDYVVIGGDARFEHLSRLLAERGKTVATLGREARPWATPADAAALGRAENIVVNCPPKPAGLDWTLEEILALAREDARVFTCGPRHPEADDGRLVDLWDDEALLLENARLTAEGAVASAMRASAGSLRDARCLVVGWGRIGRSLTELLVALGARVTVASRSASGRNRAVERGAEAVATANLGDALPGHGIVFNTAPGMVLDADTLRRADGDVLLIELASPPYGIDLHGAWSLGLRAWREPGLPGRYCPRSAAAALLAAMARHGL